MPTEPRIDPLEMLTAEGLAELWHCKPSIILELVQAMALPHVHLGDEVRIPREDAMLWKERNTSKPWCAAPMVLAEQQSDEPETA